MKRNFILTMHVPSENNITYKRPTLRSALQLREALEFFTEWPVWFSLVYKP